MYDTLIIDTNNIYARAFGVTKKNANVLDNQEIIFKTIQLAFKMILNLKDKYLLEDGKIYLLADNPTSKMKVRKQLDNDYKANRIKESDGYYRGIDFLLLIANNYSDNFYTLRITKLEADDLVPDVLELNKDKKVLLCSSDMDWARSINDTIDWYNFVAVVDKESFKIKYKFYPTCDKITLYKVLMGDVSDNIPSVFKDGDLQIVLNLIEQYSSIYDILDDLEYNHVNSFSLYTKNKILKNRQRLITNHNLIYFCDVDSSEVKNTLIKGKFNSKALMIYYKSLGFPSSFDKRVSFGQKKDILAFMEIPRA